MARLYPKIGSCPACGGTGRVHRPRFHHGEPVIGDCTAACPACHGQGLSPGERDAEADALVRHVQAIRSARRGFVPH